MSSELTISKMVHDEGFVKQAQDVLGEGTQQFLSSVLTITNSNSSLKALDPIKLYNTCLMAAALKLPFNHNLGQAYVIAYKGEPQLQIGWKGFVQLAQRSGQFKTIGATAVYENEVAGIDPLTGEIQFDFQMEKTGKVVGFMAYFRLLNGFEKNLYMTVAELEEHGKRYSQTFKANKGVWVDNFEAMAMKTVIKLLLSKFAPLSINSDLAKAIEIDQADAEGDYADNKPKVRLSNATVGNDSEDVTDEN
jgi:recombination protein RecT